MKTQTRNQFFAFLMLAITSLLFAACDTENGTGTPMENPMVQSGDHQLFTVKSGVGPVTVLFEAGMGNNYQVWNQELTLAKTGAFAQTIAYNRAGYAPSGIGSAPRNMPEIVEDLHQVITQKVRTSKLVLVGHSWGGAIIRAYAVKYPGKVDGLVFIDPTHEDFLDFNQSHEDELVKSWGQAPGFEEAEQFLEGIQYISSLNNLPDLPVRVLTAMKTNPNINSEDRQRWFNAHAHLGEGVSDFQHVGLENSDHYIQLEDPETVIQTIKDLVENL